MKDGPRTCPRHPVAAGASKWQYELTVSQKLGTALRLCQGRSADGRSEADQTIGKPTHSGLYSAQFPSSLMTTGFDLKRDQ
jgi:hypothetical protein